MKKFDIMIVRKEDPMVVVKEQGALVERMDPGFWSPGWFEALSPLLQASNLSPIKELVQDGNVIASDH